MEMFACVNTHNYVTLHEFLMELPSMCAYMEFVYECGCKV